jgi:hypothetical protein
LDGACQPVQIVFDETVAGIAVRDGYLYWNSLGRQEVRRASLDGQNVITLATGQNFGGGLQSPIATHPAGWLYSGAEFTGLVRIPLDQSSGPLLVSTVRAMAIAFDATHVYFAGYDDATEAIVVQKADLDGSNPITISFGYTPIGGLAVDASALYFTDGGYGGAATIKRASLDGSSLQVIAVSLSDPCCTQVSPLALDGATLLYSGYYAGRTTPLLMRADLDGANPTPLSIAAAQKLVVDSQTIYFTADGSTGVDYQAGVYRVSAAPAPAERLVAGNWIVGIAQDVEQIYYSVASGTPRGIWRLAK